MRMLFVQRSCSPELEQAVAQCSSLSEVLDMARPLAHHEDCFVSLQHFRGQPLAVKSYSKHRLSRLSREQVDTEARIHASLDGVDHVAPLLLAAEDERCINLLVQWADSGDLRQHLAGIGEQRLKEFVVRPLLQALAVLDSLGVVHRDVKPDNVLVHKGQVQLADFGLAVYCHHHHHHHEEEEQQEQEEQQEDVHVAEDDEHEHALLPHPHTHSLSSSSGSPIAGSGKSSVPLSFSHSLAHMPTDNGTATHEAVAAVASCNSSLPVSCRSSCSMLEALTVPHAAASLLAMPPHALHHHSAPDLQQQPALSLATGEAAAAQHHLSGLGQEAPQQLQRGRRPGPGVARPCGLWMSPASSTKLMSIAGGTPLYTAPEVLRCMFESGAIDQVVTPKNDVWSLGVLVLEVLSGTHPFSRSSNALHAIASHRAFASLPSHLSATAHAWLVAATLPDPAQRPSAAQLLAHPWLQPAAAEETDDCEQLAMAAGQQPRQQLLAAAHSYKVQHECGGGSMGGVSPTAASAQFFFQAESWEY